MRRLIAAGLAVALMMTAVPAGAEEGAPALSAASAILMEAESGRVLYQKEADVQRPIASITKLMTALVAVECGIPLDEPVAVRAEWTGAEGSSMYLRSGEELTLRTLLYGLLLVSGNDAAVAIAGYCAGKTETFVEWMNHRAADLGMEHTHFSNPNGLHAEDHYSTAYDMALLAREVLNNQVLAEIVATKSTQIGTRYLTNHNKLLWRYEGCIGLKTGYTDSAGRTLVSAAERDGMRLIAVTLKAPDDWDDHTALLDYGFSHYRLHTLARAGKVVGAVRVTGTLMSTVPVATADEVRYPLSGTESVRAELHLAETVDAPVSPRTIAGELIFFLEGQEIGRSYLTYQEERLPDRAPPGLFGRVLARMAGAVDLERSLCLLGSYITCTEQGSGGNAAPLREMREGNGSALTEAVIRPGRLFPPGGGAVHRGGPGAGQRPHGPPGRQGRPGAGRGHGGRRPPPSGAAGAVSHAEQAPGIRDHLG